MALLTKEEVLLIVGDEDEELIALLVEGVIARAKMAVPELDPEEDLSVTQVAAVKSVLLSAVARHIESGLGTVVSESAPGGYTRTLSNSARKSILYPNEITELGTIVNGYAKKRRKQAAVWGDPNFRMQEQVTPGGGTGSAIDMDRVTGLQEALDGKSPVDHDHDDRYATPSDLTGAIDALGIEDYATTAEMNSRLATKANANHTHSQYVTSEGLEDRLDDIQIEFNGDLATKADIDTLNAGLATKASTGHNHDSRYVQPAQMADAIEDFATTEALTTGLATKASTTHNHDDRYATTTHNHDARYVTRDEWDGGGGGGGGGTGSMIFRGDYNHAAAYLPGDYVNYQGVVFGCREAVTGVTPYTAVYDDSVTQNVYDCSTTQIVARDGTQDYRVARNSDYRWGFAFSEPLSVAPTTETFTVGIERSKVSHNTAGRPKALILGVVDGEPKGWYTDPLISEIPGFTGVMGIIRSNGEESERIALRFYANGSLFETTYLPYDEAHRVLIFANSSGVASRSVTFALDAVSETLTLTWAGFSATTSSVTFSHDFRLAVGGASGADNALTGPAEWVDFGGFLTLESPDPVVETARTAAPQWQPLWAVPKGVL